MNRDELYGALSAIVTAGVMTREIGDVPEYFDKLRAVIRRVVTDGESWLSEEEKQELIERLLAHVSSLEEWWGKLNLRNQASSLKTLASNLRTDK